MGARPFARFKLGLAAVIVVAWSEHPVGANYEESHVTGDDVRVTVDATGAARIEHTLAWRLIAGQPRSLDLFGVEANARLESTAAVEAEDGQVLGATVSFVDERGLRISLRDPRSLHRGRYRVRLAYTVDLAEAGELVRDGATFRIVWKGPAPREGYDAARVTFAVPGALEEPHAIVGEGGMPDDGVMSSLKRSPTHDEIELVRPHVGKGEEVLWSVGVSAKAFDTGHVAPPSQQLMRPLENRGHAPWVYGALLGLSIAFGALVRSKERRFDDACRSFGQRAQGLVPLRSWERGALAGAALFVGLSLQLSDVTTCGTLCVVLAMISAALRPPRASPASRGPGTWLVVRPEEAFGRGPDLTGLGWDVLTVGAAVLVLLGSGYLLRSVQSEATVLLPLDAAALLPLVFTGRRLQLPADLVRSDLGWWKDVFQRLAANKGLRVSPWARIPTSGSVADELRVRAIARLPMPGFVSVEVGRCCVRTPTSFPSFPELLVRVQEDSAASARLTRLLPAAVPVPGRRPEERVFRLTPPWPTAACTAALVESVCDNLVDRRIAVADVEEGAERRVTSGSRALPSNSTTHDGAVGLCPTGS